MQLLRKAFILFNLLLVLAVISYQIWHKEKTLEEGTTILLDLAPKDPRSLLQGDYMELRYAMGQFLRRDTIPPRGYLVVKLDRNQVASLHRVQAHKQPLQENEHLIRYYYHDWELYIGAESYFFQEDKAQHYEKARYGGLKVAKNGESILFGLYNEQFRKL